MKFRCNYETPKIERRTFSLVDETSGEINQVEVNEIGEFNTEPSLTIPDLSYSIGQLIRDYQVGQLPTLSELQHYYDEDEDNMDTYNDIRAEDKLDALDSIARMNKVKKEVVDRFRKMKDYEKRYQTELQTTPESKASAFGAPQPKEEQSDDHIRLKE